VKLEQVPWASCMYRLYLEISHQLERIFFFYQQFVTRCSFAVRGKGVKAPTLKECEIIYRH